MNHIMLEQLVIAVVRNRSGQTDALALLGTLVRCGYAASDIQGALQRVLERGDLRLGSRFKLEIGLA